MDIQTGGVMTNKVWMVGMMLIAFVIGMMFSQNTSAQAGQVGRYRLVEGSDHGGIVNTSWMVDSMTGRVWLCAVVGSEETCIPMSIPQTP